MPEEKTDVVVLGPPTKDGEGVHVLRATEEKVEAGELRALKEGKPIHGEVLSLEPRKDNPRVCDVRSSYRPKGPAKVNSQSYRDNWEETFGVGTSDDLPS